jgi:hypothetical protein
MQRFPVDYKAPVEPPWSELLSTKNGLPFRATSPEGNQAHSSVISQSMSFSMLSSVPYVNILFRCPVCNSSLADLGPASEQESHVKNCLDGGSGTTPQAAKYLVYKLPAESALIGVECVICLEEFAKGTPQA